MTADVTTLVPERINPATPDSAASTMPVDPSLPGGALRIALVGGGKMAEHHARAIAATPTPARLIAVADPSETGRAAIGRIAPEVRGFGSLEALLREERPDVVHIVTPLDTHFALAHTALEAGCHVYIEKPVVERGNEIAELTALAHARQRSICAGHQLLFEAPARKALELLPAIGRVCHIESYFAFRPSRRTAAGRVALRPDLQLLDILPHPVYLLLHFLEAASPAAQGEEAMTVSLGNDGTVHGILRRGDVSGALTVTLTGRPVDSYIRIVGTNGSIHADFVRGTVQRLIGPGSSAIDKILSPYRLARQLLTGTTAALFRRFARRQRSYPGLTELFEAFYHSIRAAEAPPISEATIVETVRVCEQVGAAISAMEAPAAVRAKPAAGPQILLTGGTGFLGRAVSRELVRLGCGVRVIARRAPAPWDRTPGVDYVVGDLSGAQLQDALRGMDVVLHAAAETAGGWQEHELNSIGATERVIRAAAEAGVRRVIHVSSLAVLSSAGGRPIDESTPLLADSRSAGPYVWGKLESERLAKDLAAQLGLDLRIVRPGAIVDYQNFDPPGRLGKRLGNLFVAVGSPRDRLGVVGLDFAGRMLARMALEFEQAPATLNLLDPESPTKAELLARLRRSNPDLTTLWLPMWILKPLSLGAIGMQKLLRPGRKAIDVAKVFRVDACDTRLSAALARREVVQPGLAS
jgi:predicted dehydrogenase/nucleoside-diphosphate-sugar epimerase